MTDHDGVSYSFDRDKVELPTGPAAGTPRSPEYEAWLRRRRIKRQVEEWLTFLSGVILLAFIAWATMPR